VIEIACHPNDFYFLFFYEAVKSEKKVTAQKKSEKKVNSLNDKLLVKNDKQSEETLVMPSVELKLPLVWIDLEMTGKYMLLLM
jgi:hypothetical protein